MFYQLSRYRDKIFKKKFRVFNNIGYFITIVSCTNIIVILSLYFVICINYIIKWIA